MCDTGVLVGGVDEDLFEVVEPWDVEEVDELRANPAQRGEVGGFIFRQSLKLFGILDIVTGP